MVNFILSIGIVLISNALVKTICELNNLVSQFCFVVIDIKEEFR